jgi:hypothetical protein
LLPQLGGIEIGAVVKEERVYPLEYPTLMEISATTEIGLPQNLIVQYLPEDISIDCEWFEFRNTYTKTDKSVTFNQSYIAKKKIVLQQEYKQYKDLVEDIARKTKQRIILEEK